MSDRFFSFKNRGTQLFDLQDELSRTKNAIQDQKKTIHSMRLLSVGALLAAVATAVLAGLLLTSTMHRNAELQQSLDTIGTSAAQYQADNNQLLMAVAQTAAVQPEFPTPVPTQIPTPTMIPTLAPQPQEEEAEEEIIIREEPTAVLSAADAYLDGLLGKDVTINLSASTVLFNSEALSGQLGPVFNYTQPLSGRLVSYSDTAVNIEIPFNIGRDRISSGNDTDVMAATNIRLYSPVASESTPIFILQGAAPLAAPATDCTDVPGQSFCHGTFSIWFARSVVEYNIH